MTRRQAEEAAARLGMSAWMVEAVAVGSRSRVVELMCVGFKEIDLPIAESESWESALEQAARFASKAQRSAAR